MAANLPAASGCGVAVPARTDPEPSQNRQVSEIISVCSLVLRFQSVASRDARAGACVGLRVYAHVREARTSEPTYIIQSNQMDSGSEMVLERFQPEPAPRGAGRGRGFAPISNILVGGYAAAAVDRARRGLSRSRGGERFGVFGLGGRADRAGCSSSTRRGRNGGKASVSGGADRVVGTPMLERMAESRGFAPFSASPHLPSGKAAGLALGGRGTPPCPLSRSRQGTAPGRSSVPEFGSASACSPDGSIAAREKSARRRFRPTGPGEVLRVVASPALVPGRGDGDAAEKLRRMTCMGGGIDCVK